MYSRILMILFAVFAVGLFIQPAVLADDDAMMDIDNTENIFKSGTWQESSWAPCATGGSYYYAWGGSAAAIMYETAQTADITGEYAVYARWTSHANRNNNVQFDIYNGPSAVATIHKDQRNHSCNWQYLKTIMLTAGNKGRVMISNPGATAGEVTVADGIRFLRVSRDDNDIIDNAGLGVAEKAIKYLQNISTFGSPMTNLQSVSITVPPSPSNGRVIVRASGNVRFYTGDKWLYYCISKTSGGNSTTCSSLVHDLNIRDQHEGNDFAISVVFTEAAGTHTYYLKAIIHESGAEGPIKLDQMTALYVPESY